MQLIKFNFDEWKNLEVNISITLVLGILILLFLVIFVVWIVKKYNKFVQLKNKVEESFSTMDVFLKKRYDLIPNLVEIVKGYTTHESQTLENVIAARNMALHSNGMEDRIRIAGQFQSMLGPLYSIRESYPALKADRQYTDLMDQLNDIENDIEYSRRYYNAVVNAFNNTIEAFPNNILANIFHFTKKQLFEIEITDKENVKVDFANKPLSVTKTENKEEEKEEDSNPSSFLS